MRLYNQGKKNLEGGSTTAPNSRNKSTIGFVPVSNNNSKSSDNGDWMRRRRKRSRGRKRRADPIPGGRLSSPDTFRLDTTPCDREKGHTPLRGQLLCSLSQ